MAKSKYLLMGNALDQFKEAAPALAALSLALAQHYNLFLQAIEEVKQDPAIKNPLRKSLDTLSSLTVHGADALTEYSEFTTKLFREVRAVSYP